MAFNPIDELLFLSRDNHGSISVVIDDLFLFRYDDDLFLFRYDDDLFLFRHDDDLFLFRHDDDLFFLFDDLFFLNLTVVTNVREAICGHGAIDVSQSEVTLGSPCNHRPILGKVRVGPVPLSLDAEGLTSSHFDGH